MLELSPTRASPSPSAPSPRAHQSSETVHLANFRDKGVDKQPGGDGLERRLQCKVEGCKGRVYVRVNSDGTRDEKKPLRWTTRCSHPPLPEPKVDPSAAERRRMVTELLQRGHTVVQVEVEMSRRGMSVTQALIHAANQALRRENTDLTSRLSNSPFVDSICLKYGGIPLLSVITVDPNVCSIAGGPAAIRHVFLDGTHAVGARGGQMMTLLGWIPECADALPLAHAMVQGATQTHYMTLLNRARELGIMPTHVHVDFEVAEHNAINTVWPSARVAGCYFHVKQAALRQWRNHFGQRRNKEWNTANDYISRMAFSTTVEAFDFTLKEFAEWCRQNGAKAYLDYFQRTWIVRFRPQLWTIVGETDLLAKKCRTNNVLEGYHSVLKNNALDRNSRQLDQVVRDVCEIDKALWERAKMNAAPAGDGGDDDILCWPVEEAAAKAPPTANAPPPPTTGATTTPRAISEDAVATAILGAAATAPPRPTPKAIEWNAALLAPCPLEQQNSGYRLVAARAAAMNMRLTNVPSDGNCMFHALALAEGGVVTGATIRREVTEFVANHAALRTRLTEFAFHGDEAAFNQWLWHMRRDGEWGDHLVLVARATMTRRNIAVHPADGTAPIVTAPLDGEAQRTDLHLFHENGVHFMAFTPTNNAPLRDIVTTRLAETRNRGRHKKRGERVRA